MIDPQPVGVTARTAKVDRTIELPFARENQVKTRVAGMLGKTIIRLASVRIPHFRLRQANAVEVTISSRPVVLW